MRLAKLLAMLVITVGGVLSGLISGSGLGTVRLDLELGHSQLEWLGAFCGLVLAIVGCCLATEYQKACERNRMYINVVKRLADMRIG
jgi:hypothetical protein